MTLLLADGFDHWGIGATGVANMLLGTYSYVSTIVGNLSVTSANARTGNCLIINSTGGLNTLPTITPTWARYPIPALSSVGCGFAIYMTAAPQSATSNLAFRLPGYIDNNGSEIAAVYISTSGQICFMANGVTFYQSAGAVFPNAAYCFLEIQATAVVGGGMITISMTARINGAVVGNASSAAFPQVTYQGLFNGMTLGCGNFSNSGGGYQPQCTIYIDDFYVYSLTGANNNTFLGDRRCRTLMPSADTVQADWLKNSGTVGFNRINEIPQDGDTTYIQATAAGNKSNFGFQTVPANTSDIAGICTYFIAKKSDAGACNIRTDIIANAATAAGVSIPITTAYNYYTTIIERDGTGIQFTPTTLNSGLLSLVRVA